MGHHYAHHHHHRALTNKHPSLHYDRTYSGYHEAVNCWHVQTAAEHHNVDLFKLAKMLASGLNLVSAIIGILTGFGVTL